MTFRFIPQKTRPLPQPVYRTALATSIFCLLLSLLLVQGVHAGYVSGTLSGEPLMFGSPEASGILGNEPLNETLKAQLRTLPLSFIPNAGQTDPAVRFMVKGSGTSFSFTNTSLLFSIQRSQNETPLVITQTFTGANEYLRVTGEDLLPGIANYFIGDDPDSWHSNISTYGAVRYHDLYPGIDLVYRGNGSVLKREFIVTAGADPSLIRMGYTDADSLSIDETGALTITADTGSMTESRPICFQDIDGDRKDFYARYVLSGENELTIKVDAYDSAYELVIDPDLVYSTYLGGSDGDYGRGIAVDSTGNAYVTGYTYSTNFPVTSEAYQTSSAGHPDAFVTKLNSAGNALVYSTYLGGSSENEGHGIAVDASGNAYVTGVTYSTDYPTTAGANQTSSAGHSDAFVTKLNAAGSALLYSTYLGGSSYDYGRGIAVDSTGNAYVTGETESSGFPTTAGANQTSFGGGGYDAFVTKLNSAGSGLVYSTYLGGSSSDYGRGIAVDASGNAYVTGKTGSTNFPTTTGAYQTSFGGGDSDAFVTKLNSAGSGLDYSTYLGGTGSDFGYGITLESTGNAYVTGETYGTDFPVTAGAYQTSSAGNGDSFVTKLTAAGNSLIYSTYLGGSSSDSGRGIAVDASGDAYVTGPTGSWDYPTTAGANQTSSAGHSDAFVTKLQFSDPPTITVTSPNGGEIWKQGTIHTIRWTYTGDPGANVKIQLLKAGVVKKVISTSAPIGTGGSGSFTWKVPFNQALGKDYKIRIISTSDATKRDASDKVFTISAGAPITVKVPNGGEIWKRGTIQTIRWNYTGNPGAKVKIELLKGTKVNRVITAAAPIGTVGGGLYKWKIPANQVTGTDYRIRITSTTQPTKKDVSNKVFRIKA